MALRTAVKSSLVNKLVLTMCKLFLECFIDDARNFSIEGFEEDYSFQEV